MLQPRFTDQDPAVDAIHRALDRLDSTLPAYRRLATAEEVLNYWFSGTAEDRKTRHWKGLKETDDEIRAKFLPTWEALSNTNDTAMADQWASGGIRSILALVIVWDQFSRSLWRGDGRSFRNDGRAGKLSMETLKSGADAELTEGQFFLKMPLLHSEDLEVHKWNAGTSDPDATDTHIQGHLKVIERFGRFPKRNAAMGRESTPEELEYLSSDEAQGRPY